MTAPTTTAASLSARVDCPLDALVSYHYYKADKDMESLVETRRLRMIGDSGAFSAYTQGTPIKLDEYAAWLGKWHPYLCWAASLDVIGDPVATLANWRVLRDRHGLATVPTLHAGTDPKWLDAYVAEGVDFFGLGGLVGRALDALPWVVRVFRYVRDRHPQVRFHLWGVTNRKYLDNLPAYSADSSGILGGGYRFAQLRLFDPRSGKHTTVQMRDTNVFKAGALLRQVYGIDPAAIVRPTPANRHLLVQIAAHGTQLYAGWLQRRHQVSAPTWGLHTPRQLQSGPVAGTRLHPVADFRSHQGRSAVEVAVGVPPVAPPGTRLHPVSTVGRDYEDAVGTRVHLVDANPKRLPEAAGCPQPREVSA